MPAIVNGTDGLTFPSWTTGTRPTSLAAGQVGYNTTLNVLETYNGTTWIGVPAPSTAGNVLTSNGTSWTSAAAAAFDAGTRMAFQQTAAPTGWTKDTTAGINDSMLRLVIGTASSGGTTAFSTWSAVTSTGSYTLATADIPSHTHSVANQNAVQTSSGKGANFAGTTGGSTGGAGGGGGHSHSLTRSLKYYDFIIASKN
jgi:hypothetical protein